MTTPWRHRALAAEQLATRLQQEVERLLVEVERLRARPATGRPSAAPLTEKSRLVAQVCLARGWTRGELARRLSEVTKEKVDQAFLSPSRPFSEARREVLMKWLREWAE